MQRLSQSRAIALDMESATIAANGYQVPRPLWHALCVSDKPLHGELKLPGMASDFYKTQVARHLMIGITSHGNAARNAAGTVAQPKTAVFRRNSLPVGRKPKSAEKCVFPLQSTTIRCVDPRDIPVKDNQMRPQYSGRRRRPEKWQNQ